MTTHHDPGSKVQRPTTHCAWLKEASWVPYVKFPRNRLRFAYRRFLGRSSGNNTWQGERSAGLRGGRNGITEHVQWWPQQRGTVELGCPFQIFCYLEARELVIVSFPLMSHWMWAALRQTCHLGLNSFLQSRAIPGAVSPWPPTLLTTGGTRTVSLKGSEKPWPTAVGWKRAFSSAWTCLCLSDPDHHPAEWSMKVGILSKALKDLE